MGTLFRKELRQQAIVVVGALVLGVLILDRAAGGLGWALLPMGALRGAVGFSRVIVDFGRIYDPLPLATWSWCCALTAVALALRQVFHEQWMKTWPLLAHLPVGRARIAVAKLLAGAVCYAAVTLPLLALMLVRLATPGVWPGPFSIRIAMPLLLTAFLMAGVYVAVFAASLRPARWYGTKWLMALAAVPFVFGAVAVAIEPLARYYIEAGRSGYNYVPAAALYALAGAALVTGLLSLWSIVQTARTREY